jgi:hypothetical protein
MNKIQGAPQLFMSAYNIKITPALTHIQKKIRHSSASLL